MRKIRVRSPVAPSTTRVPGAEPTAGSRARRGLRARELAGEEEGGASSRSAIARVYQGLGRARIPRAVIASRAREKPASRAPLVAGPRARVARPRDGARPAGGQA